MATAAFLLNGSGPQSTVFAKDSAPEAERATENQRKSVRGLLSVARSNSHPLKARVAAAKQALASDVSGSPFPAFRAGLTLIKHAPEVSCALLRATHVIVDEADRTQAIRALISAAKDAKSAEARSLLWTTALELGHLDDDIVSGLLTPWPPSQASRDALHRHFDLANTKSDPSDVAAWKVDAPRRITSWLAIYRVLHRANHDDPKIAAPALDELVAMGAKALPTLHHIVAQAVEAPPATKLKPSPLQDKALRAILALGFIGDDSSIPLLVACLGSKTNGWIRARAAVALGDTRKPAAAPTLGWQLCIMSDLFRSRDEWDYPGTQETTLLASDWASAPYFSVDAHAADALLRLGVPGAAGYVIQQKLDPAKANFRVRVLQDAVDTLRRNVKNLDASIYNVDEGTPLRRAAHKKLASWWKAHGATGVELATTLDENDPGFVRAADQLAERLLGNDARSFIITKATCALLGRCMTPSLLRTLEKATKASSRCEIAVALGKVGDPRAIAPLLELSKVKRDFVRAKAFEALGSYCLDDPHVIPTLIASVEGTSESPRIAAMKALVMAPRDKRVYDVALRSKGDDPDFQCARQVTLYVQGDATPWDRIEAGLKHEERVIRRTWWDLLRRGMDLPLDMFDPNAKPGSSPKTAMSAKMIEPYRKARGATTPPKDASAGEGK